MYFASDIFLGSEGKKFQGSRITYFKPNIPGDEGLVARARAHAHAHAHARNNQFYRMAKRSAIECAGVLDVCQRQKQR